MDLFVSGWSIGIIALNILIGIGIPLAILLWLRKKYPAPVWVFFIGCGVFLIFALTLEQLIHAAVFSSSFGRQIQSNIWYYGLYGGIMAAVFEECGRYIVMRFLMKKQHGNPNAALMYGAGHGGFEMFSVLSLNMLNNLIFAILINTGMTQTLLSPLNDTMRDQLNSVFATLAATNPAIFLASPLERLFALIAQIGMSVFVWISVTRKDRRFLFPIALGTHFVLDFSAAVINGSGASIFVTEAVVLLLSLIIFLSACRLLRTEMRAEKTEPVLPE